MDKVSELERRVTDLESSMEACMGVLKKLIRDFYEPEFVEKIDKLVDYGKGDRH